MKTVIIISLISLAACNTPPGKPTAAVQEQGEIFPVTSFVNDQVNMVDSLGLPVMKYITVDHKTDTSLVSLEEFKKLAKEFIEPDIASPQLMKYYKEASFADQSVPSVTLTYSTARKDLEVQRVDVIIDPDPVLTDKVKSLYLEKASRNDSIFTFKKMFWKAGNSFQIITSSSLAGKPARVKQLKVAWNLND